MSKIKVTVKDIKTANEIIKFWKDEDLNLEIVVKENTATANSDVNDYEIGVGEKGRQQYTELISKL